MSDTNWYWLAFVFIKTAIHCFASDLLSSHLGTDSLERKNKWYFFHGSHHRVPSVMLFWFVVLNARKGTKVQQIHLCPSWRNARSDDGYRSQPTRADVNHHRSTQIRRSRFGQVSDSPPNKSDCCVGNYTAWRVICEGFPPTLEQGNSFSGEAAGRFGGTTIKFMNFDGWPIR